MKKKHLTLFIVVLTFSFIARLLTHKFISGYWAELVWFNCGILSILIYKYISK